jgi:hypothetical protein
VTIEGEPIERVDAVAIARRVYGEYSVGAGGMGVTGWFVSAFATDDNSRNTKAIRTVNWF